jgi:hypothetical protein
MIKVMIAIILTVALNAVYSGTAHATHDSGQGKSQDGNDNDLASISVAPEPSTYWLFLAGSLAMVIYAKRKKETTP